MTSTSSRHHPKASMNLRTSGSKLTFLSNGPSGKILMDRRSLLRFLRTSAQYVDNVANALAANAFDSLLRVMILKAEFAPVLRFLMDERRYSGATGSMKSICRAKGQ